MRPLLHSGDWIEVDWFSDQGRLAAPSLTPGELIVGRFSEGEWVVHRYIGRHKSGEHRLLIKGDASFCWDELHENQIWGRVKTLKSETRKRQIFHKPGLLAGWIARLSLGTVPPDTIKARILRRLIFLLSWIEIKTTSSILS